ncbi:hypothetical protein F5X96DRAFT_656621 [Biscogniauxia mediterranea]|nr:hypothetical protein F5X96DRAFT_656621 [Biscogniauxia mediterranea]
MAGGQERGRGDARRSSSPQESNMKSTNSELWMRSRTTVAARGYQSYHHHSSYETYAPPYSTSNTSNPNQSLLPSPMLPYPSSSSSSLATSIQTPRPVLPPLSRRRDSIFQPRGYEAQLAPDLARPPVFYSRSFPISQPYTPSLRGREPIPSQSAFLTPGENPLPRIPSPAQQGYTLVSPQLPPLLTLFPPLPPRRGTKRRHTYDGGDEHRYAMPPPWLNGPRALEQGRERQHGNNSLYDRVSRSSSPLTYVPPSPSEQAAAWKEEKKKKKRDDDHEKGYHYEYDDMDREIVDGEGEGEGQAGPVHEGISPSPRIDLLNSPAPDVVRGATQGRMSIANLLC